MNVRRPIPFRFVLPAVELLICGILLWPFVGFILFQVRSAAEPQVRLNVDGAQLKVNITTRPLSPSEQRATKIIETRLSLPVLLNIPCGFLGLARNEIFPGAMLPELWRAVTWPVIGVFFWWIAGRSVDALLASRRRVLSPSITLAEVLLGCYLIGLSALLCIGFLDPSMRDEFILPWSWAAPACGLWVGLGFAIVAARFVQRGLKRSGTSTIQPL